MLKEKATRKENSKNFTQHPAGSKNSSGIKINFCFVHIDQDSYVKDHYPSTLVIIFVIDSYTRDLRERVSTLVRLYEYNIIYVYIIAYII